MTNDILYCYIRIKALGGNRTDEYDGTIALVFPWLRSLSGAPGYALRVSTSANSFMYYLDDLGVKDSSWMVPCL